MNPKNEALKNEIESAVEYLEMTATNIAYQITRSYSFSPHCSELYSPWGTVKQELNNFLKELKLLNIKLEGALDEELKNCTSRLQDARDVLNKGMNCGINDTIAALKIVENNTLLLTETVAVIRLHASNKITKLTTQDEAEQNFTQLKDRVTQLESKLESALAEIAKLKGTSEQLGDKTALNTPNTAVTFFS